MAGRAQISTRNSALIAMIADEDTVVGMLLARVGNVDLRRKTNYLIVDSKTTVKQIEDAFKEFTTREDIAVVLISQFDIWNKTWYPKAIDHVNTEKPWYIVDAEDLILGRLASTIAIYIRGKNLAEDLILTVGFDYCDFRPGSGLNFEVGYAYEGLNVDVLTHKEVGYAYEGTGRTCQS